jgi:hypothetical protein
MMMERNMQEAPPDTINNRPIWEELKLYYRQSITEAWCAVAYDCAPTLRCGAPRSAKGGVPAIVEILMAKVMWQW